MPSKAMEGFSEVMEEGVEAILMVAFFSLVVLIPYLSVTGVSDDHPWLRWALVGLAIALFALIVLSRLGGGPDRGKARLVPRAPSDRDGDGTG